MLWIDYLLLSLLTVSALFGMVRGFVRELLSIAVWVAAFSVAGYFYPYVTPYLTTFSRPLLRDGIAIIGLLVSVLLVGGVVNTLICQLIVRGGLSNTDRLLGVGFGLLRGFLMCCTLLLCWDSFFSGSQHPVWQQSQLIPYCNSVTRWFLGHLSAFFDDLPSV